MENIPPGPSLIERLSWLTIAPPESSDHLGSLFYDKQTTFHHRHTGRKWTCLACGGGVFFSVMAIAGGSYLVLDDRSQAEQIGGFAAAATGIFTGLFSLACGLYRCWRIGRVYQPLPPDPAI